MADLLIKNGLIADGTGAEPYYGSIYVTDGKIEEITAPDAPEHAAGRIIDAAGLTVAPGFIDIHTHSDWAPFQEKFGESKILQGITTEITGNCADSPFPFPEDPDRFESHADYVQAVSGRKIPVNLGQLVGHHGIRAAVVGYSDREPDDAELAAETALLDRELSSGAFGMSLGLIYAPSTFAKRDELIALARVLQKHDKILSVHMRNEQDHIFEAVDEMLDIVRETGVRLEISHLKLMGRAQWGKTRELLQKLENARNEGLPVYCDQYPYTASSTGLKGALIPKEMHVGGDAALLKRLQDPSEELLRAIREKIEGRCGAGKILIVEIRNHPEYSGRYLDEIASSFGISPEEAVVRLTLEGQGGSSAVFFCIDEQDMLAIMRERFISVGSDGNSVSYEIDSDPHPRFFGTFPHYLKLALGQGIQLQEAVYKMTGLPAAVLGIRDRGILKAGMKADLTLFDPETVDGVSDYMAPKQKPSGIAFVIVNGAVAVENNKVLKEDAGQLLKRV